MNMARVKFFPQLCMVVFLVAFWGLFVGEAFAYLGQTTAKQCPAKVLETKRVRGTYLGWQYEDSFEGGVVEIGLQDERVLFVYATEEQAQRFFGKNENMVAEITYELIQDFSYKTSQCEAVLVLRYAELLPNYQYEVATYEEAISDQIFYTSTVEGTFVKYVEGGDFNYIDFIVDGQELYFTCGEAFVTEQLGTNAKGKRFALTYTAERLVFDGEHFLNVCQSAVPAP